MSTDMLDKFILPIVLSIFASSGFWTFLTNRKNKSSEILERLIKLEKRFDETEAMNKRNRIVRFADEIRSGMKHSKDLYDHCFLDIDAYERYCGEHPKFKNSIAEVSIKKIKEHYSKDDFL